MSGDDNGDDTNHNRIKKKVTGKRAMENNTNTMNKKNRTEIRAPYQFIFDDEDDGDDVVDDENGDDEDGDDNVLQPALLSMLLRDKRKMFSVTGQMKKIIKNSKNYEASKTKLRLFLMEHNISSRDAYSCTRLFIIFLEISGNMLLAKLLEAGTNKGPNGKVRAAEKFHAIWYAIVCVH